ncbi:hypothetical protein F4777DRAFT_525745 [Nemania sp. FL0916]|nr:hypothetical protein F4777DRAFT_525745 [Nemania sp. FL0916]
MDELACWPTLSSTMHCKCGLIAETSLLVCLVFSVVVLVTRSPSQPSYLIRVDLGYYLLPRLSRARDSCQRGCHHCTCVRVGVGPAVTKEMISISKASPVRLTLRMGGSLYPLKCFDVSLDLRYIEFCLYYESSKHWRFISAFITQPDPWHYTTPSIIISSAAWQW